MTNLQSVQSRIELQISKLNIVFGALLLFGLSIAQAPSALAHGGGTDANGCHKDSSTGIEHCHDNNPSVDIPVSPTSGTTARTPISTSQCGLPGSVWQEIASRGETMNHIIVRKKNCIMDIQVHR